MSVRENLLRLRRWRLQEQRDYLAGLEALLARLHGDKRRLQDEVTEGLRAPDPDDADYPLLVRPLIERQRKIERSIVEVETRIGEAREAVNAALLEVKMCEGAIGAASPSDMSASLRRSRRERHGAFPGMPVRRDRPRSV